LPFAGELWRAGERYEAWHTLDELDPEKTCQTDAIASVL
jgi:hypothetical protein